MRKLKLDLADLTVDSFDIPSRGDGRGTLYARSGHAEGTENTQCWGLTCPACGDTAYVFCTASGCDTGGGGSGASGDTTCQNSAMDTCDTCPSADPCSGHAGPC
jgi:hypothetical protein